MDRIASMWVGSGSSAQAANLPWADSAALTSPGGGCATHRGIISWPPATRSRAIDHPNQSRPYSLCSPSAEKPRVRSLTIDEAMPAIMAAFG